MKDNIEDIYIYTEDSWDDIRLYRITETVNDEIFLVSASIFTRESKPLIIQMEDRDKLHIYPFYFFSKEKHKKLGELMWRVGDLVCAFLNKHGSLSLKMICECVLKHKEKYHLDTSGLECILRCLTAAKIITPFIKKESIYFSVSKSYKIRESERNFSASIAGELESLSERVRNIISHGPTVGGYRENILQSTLKKHLPERYHIATGFIFGVHKQIDILIYDRIDYSPIFREGDLVIVPPESVRAVIEVKTRLTSKELISSLDAMKYISMLDDCQPPFFKGIFSFESSLASDKINQVIVKFYTDLNHMSQGGVGDIICHPFRHMTCSCVHNKSFSYIQYDRNNNKRLVPVLYSKQSASGLKSQTTFFIQSLLSYLKFGGIKPFKIDYSDRMLGEDTFLTKIQELCADGDSWGIYYRYDNDDVNEDEVVEMEKLVLSTQQWIYGEYNL
ncbi:DUF6602 domain-containing protein [Pectobacterium versatile]|uniref:DUF6602 domain-containing protein n=1 Tax=Pectobacterium versatile TaxID=2488639 RepID=UPI0020C022A9|nr:DUF6602 domain-containing protein [Pectobacterium versatile]